MADFDKQFHLPAASLRVVTTLGGDSSKWAAYGEEVLDAEMVHAVAPGAAIVIVLLPPTALNNTANAVASSIASLRLASTLGGVISTSEGGQVGGEPCVTKAQASQVDAVLSRVASLPARSVRPALDEPVPRSRTRTRPARLPADQGASGRMRRVTKISNPLLRADMPAAAHHRRVAARPGGPPRPARVPASGVHGRDGTASGATVSRMRPDIRPGGVFPDYALPDHTGTVRKLSELQGRDPLILTLARGNYCPKEHQQHLELAANYPKIAVAYTQIATIATDDHHTLQEFRASVGAQWTFLSDPGRTVQQDLDIAEYTDPEHNPMIPHTLVLKPGLVIHSVYNGYWFWGRPSFYDLWQTCVPPPARSARTGPEHPRAPPSLGRARLLQVPRLDRRSPGSTPTSYE